MVDKKNKRAIIKLSTQKHAGAGAKGAHTMTRTTATKDEEMKALRKIRDIVEKLGSDSYLAISTEGFWGMAEANILNDMGDSVITLVEANRKANEEVRVLERQFKEMSKDYENALAIITTDKEKMDAYWKQLEDAYADKKRTTDNLQGIIDGLDVKLGDTMKELEELRASKGLEIMKLKAEVYDLKKGGNGKANTMGQKGRETGTQRD